MTKGSDLLVAALEGEGVERIFGIPGEENLDVVESLRTSEDRACPDPARTGRGLHGRDVGAADGTTGVCLSTLGPGALNFVDRRRLRTSRCDADADDHGQKPHQKCPPGALPDCRCRRGDAAADQDDASDRVGGVHSDDCPRCIPCRRWRNGRVLFISSFPKISPPKRRTQARCRRTRSNGRSHPRRRSIASPQMISEAKRRSS